MFIESNDWVKTEKELSNLENATVIVSCFGVYNFRKNFELNYSNEQDEFFKLILSILAEKYNIEINLYGDIAVRNDFVDNYIYENIGSVIYIEDVEYNLAKFYFHMDEPIYSMYAKEMLIEEFHKILEKAIDNGLCEFTFKEKHFNSVQIVKVEYAKEVE